MYTIPSHGWFLTSLLAIPLPFGTLPVVPHKAVAEVSE